MGGPLQIKEALDLLALKPGASPLEIKEAYRDLVKVWHPDRFGSDPRLRQKAEDRLRDLNEAYGVLQAGSAVEGVDATEPAARTGHESGFTNHYSARYSTAPPMPGRARTRWAGGAGWIFGCVGVVLGCLAGYLALERGAARTAPLASAQQVAGDSQRGEQAASAPVAQTAGGVVAGPDNSAAEQPGRNVQANGSSVDHASSAPFRVWALSEAQTAQVESSCSRQRELKGQAAYQACVKAQLDVITNASGAPDLQALSGTERESIESVCGQGRRGSGAYNRCLNVQMASLAEEPLRPDLSALSDDDRSSIEVACRNAKYKEGPAAYDRCLMRFVKLLAETK
jgi:curved DNA-binding protein CbpA